VLTEAKIPKRLLKKRSLLAKVPVSNALLYGWMDKSSPYYDPTFPKPIRLAGGRSVFWIEEEIDQWLEISISQRDDDDHGPDKQDHTFQKTASKVQGTPKNHPQNQGVSHHV